MTTDKTTMSYRAGYNAALAGKQLADDPAELFENWTSYQVGFIDGLAERIRLLEIAHTK